MKVRSIAAHAAVATSAAAVTAVTTKIFAAHAAQQHGEPPMLEIEQESAADRQLASVLDGASSLLVMTDADDTMTYVSRRSRQLLGFEPDELSDRPFSSLVLPVDRRRVIEAAAAGRVAEPDEPLSVEFSVVTRDGRARLVEADLRAAGLPSSTRGSSKLVWVIRDRANSVATKTPEAPTSASAISSRTRETTVSSV